MLAQVILYDALDLKVLNKVVACRSRVVAVSFSQDGKLLATASEQGTVIRIFTVPAAVKVRYCVPGMLLVGSHSKFERFYPRNMRSCKAPLLLVAVCSRRVIEDEIGSRG